MASEKPANLLKRKKTKQCKSNERTCIIHSPNLLKYGDVKTFTDSSWKKVTESKATRLQVNNTKVRKIDICDQIPEVLNEISHGYHRPCYQIFTNLRDCRKREAVDETQAVSPRKRRVIQNTGPHLPQHNCIICCRKNKYVNRKSERLIPCVTETARNSITEAARLRCDSRMISLTETHCLIAQQAVYHESCRKKYLKTEHWRTSSTTTSTDSNQKQLEEAYANSFKYICEYIQKHIIDNSNVERMTMIKERYLEHLKSHYPDMYNPNYKTYKLKDKLQKHFGRRIQFWQPNYRSDLLYSTEIPKGAVVETAFEIASSDERRLEEAALVLRRVILDAFSYSQPLPWPPSSAYLLSKQSELPVLLVNFMSKLLSAKPSNYTKSIHLKRLVSSIAQDICYNITHGQWKMPKHLLLGMTVRHITGSAKVINIFNRLGHCASHSTLLELETAMSDSVSECPSSLPAGAAKQAVITHLCWDNFDMAEETPSGAGTTHSTHGIIIQEPCRDPPQPDNTANQQTCNGVEICKSKRRSATFVPQQLETCFDTGKVEPKFDVTEAEFSYEREDLVKKSFFLWMLCRLELNVEHKFIFPGWKGWVSATSDQHQPETQSIVNYMPPINASVNDMSTVQKVLQISQNATRETGQQWTFVTFDLAVAKKAYALVWQHPETYKNVVVHLGVFHTMMSYLGALGKVMQGSGLEEILVEARLCASGSLKKVLSGKHYNRAMRVHTHVLEALERLLFASFLNNTGCGRLLKELLSNAKELQSNISHSVFESVISSEELVQLFAQYEVFKKQVGAGHLGKTAQYWLQYMERIWLLLQFLFATKTNNLGLHIFCLQKLCPLLFSMNHQNYAKYLSVYYTILVSLPQEAKDLLQRNGFSVSRSNIPGTRAAVDMTIEQTINKHAKTRGGIVGFSRSLPAYYRWCVTRHNRAQYVSATYEMANMESKNFDTHKETTPAEAQLSETAVQKTMDAFSAFLNPFDIEREHLICLSSGQNLPIDVTEDLLKVEDIGNKNFEEFVETRLKDKSVKFHKPLNKTKLKTFASVSKVTSIKTARKDVKGKAQRNVFGQLLILSQEHEIDMEKVLKYPLSPVPWSLSSPDGLPLKTSKATLMHKLEKDCVESEDMSKLPNTSSIVDGNALLHCLSGSQCTFGDIAKQAFLLLPQTATIHFVTDTYVKNSIKSCERIRRGSSNICTRVLQGPATKVPRNWKEFLLSEENKKALIRFLHAEWKSDAYAQLLKNKKLFFVCEESCELLTSDENEETVNSIPVQDLCSSQEEADTRIVLHCLYASQHGSETIIVRSPDTDVFVLLLSNCDIIGKKLIFDTGTANNRRQVNISKISAGMSKLLRDAIVGMHAFTGCDSTSCFAGKGKMKALKLLQEDQELQDTFARLGNSETIASKDQNKIEAFVCQLYGNRAHTSVDKVRYDKVLQSYKGKKGLLSHADGVDLSKMPPCKDVLLLHTQRANYQTQIWRTANVNFPDIPKPEDNGWEISSSGGLEVKWYRNDFLPKELQDILSVDLGSQNDEEEESEILNESDDFSSSDEELVDTDDEEC